jgi:hypothetical protein
MNKTTLEAGLMRMPFGYNRLNEKGSIRNL